MSGILQTADSKRCWPNNGINMHTINLHMMMMMMMMMAQV